MPGFNTGLSQKKDENTPAKNKLPIDLVSESLPKEEDTLPRLFSLDFFALCPNGKRIPVQDICKVYETEPEGLLLRTFDDRLILVLQAIFRGQSTPYWQQAFYLSTGQSSEMGGTWLPFDGIVMEGQFHKEISVNWGVGRPRKDNEKLLLATPWFSKDSFCGTGTRPFLPSTMNERIYFLLKYAYGKLYLPEGEGVGYIRSGPLREGYGTYHRFGTISYAMASYKIGGSEFEEEKYGDVLEDSTPAIIQESIKNFMKQKSPLQTCFLTMAKTYPISKPNEVNAYIEKQKAFSYMNAFRSENIFPPGLSFVSVPIKSLGYSMPIKDYAAALNTYVREVWKSYQMKEFTVEQVREKFNVSKEELNMVLASVQEYCVMPNEPGIEFNLNPGAYASNPNKLKPYYGGKPTKRRRAAKKRKNKKTRKH